MPQTVDYARRLVKGSSMVFVGLIGANLLGVLFRMFLTRTIDVAEYGLFFAVLALISFIGLLRDPGLSAALIKHMSEFIAKKRQDKAKSSMIFVLGFQAVLAAIVAVVLITFSDQIALAIFGTGAASLIIKIMGVWFLVDTFFIFFQMAYQSFQDMSMSSLMFFSRALCILLFAAGFIRLLGADVRGVPFAYLFASLTVAIFGFATFMKKYKRSLIGKISITKSLANKILAFALLSFGGMVGLTLIDYTDTLTITIFRSVSEVGFYQTALPLSRLLWFFSMALGTALFPLTSELWAKKEKKALGSMLHFMTKLSFVLIIPLSLALIAFPEIVIRLLFGDGYLAATRALQILSITAIVYTLYYISVMTIGGIGKPAVSTGIIFFMAALNLVGNIALVPIIGIEGAAITTLLTYVVGLILSLRFIARYIGFPVPAASIFKTAIGAIITLAIIFYLKSVLVLFPWVEAFVVLAPSLLFYLVWVLATKTITKNDLMVLKRLVLR